MVVKLPNVKANPVYLISFSDTVKKSMDAIKKRKG